MSQATMTAGFTARPTTANCRRIFEIGQHVLIGVSPFNTRFSLDYLCGITRWAEGHFERVGFLLPGDGDAALLLEATGNSPGKALRKSRKELNRVLRTVRLAIDAAGLPGKDYPIVRFDDFADDPTYLKMRHATKLAHDSHAAFRLACREMSLQAIQARQRAVGLAAEPLTDEQFDLASRYIFAEVPFFTGTPALLDVPTSSLAYHRPWPIGDLLFSGELPIRVDPRQGYLVVRARDDSFPGLFDDGTLGPMSLSA